MTLLNVITCVGVVSMSAHRHVLDTEHTFDQC